jgi:hypothetical protein
MILLARNDSFLLAFGHDDPEHHVHENAGEGGGHDRADDVQRACECDVDAQILSQPGDDTSDPTIGAGTAKRTFHITRV